MSLIARIEDDLCLAHGDCEAVAPEAFRVDDVARVVGETTDERLRAAHRGRHREGLVRDIHQPEQEGLLVLEPRLVAQHAVEARPREAARGLLERLSGPEGRAILRAKGMQPPG